MTDKTYSIPSFIDDPSDLIDELFEAGANGGIVGTGRLGKIAISIDDATSGDIDMVWLTAIKSLDVKTKRNQLDLALSADDAVRTEVMFDYYDKLEQDLNDVAAYCALKYNLPDLQLHIEIRLNRHHHCDLSTVNAIFVQPRDLRVAVREKAKHLLELMGYHFDFIDSLSLDLYEPKSRQDLMSGHEKLQALKRIDDLVA